MKLYLTVLALLFASHAHATSNAVFEGDCGMQTAPRDTNHGPRIFAVAHVKLKAGESYTIYKQGKLTYSVDFIGDEEPRPFYGIIVSLVDKTSGRKVSEATAFSHDLQALENINVGLYVPDFNPTAFCGKRM